MTKHRVKPSKHGLSSLPSKAFPRARSTIAAYYVGSMLVLLVIFNFGLYGLFVSDLPDRTQATLTPAQQLLVDEAGGRLERTLFWVDGAMLVAVALAGYYMAGKTLRPIEAAHTAQQQFIGDAAHELRTPLAVMKIAAQTVLAGKRDRQTLEKLAEDSLEEVNALSHIAEDMLFLAKQDEYPEVRLEKVDLTSLAASCASLMKPYAANHGVSLTLRGSRPCYIRGNADDIKRLLMNLTHNAITYNKSGGSVELSVAKAGKSIRLVVADTGVGISLADQPHIFQRFYKADEARPQQSMGAGLGLSIVQEIVNNHHGDITLASEPGVGTEITILFPAFS